MQQRGSVLKDYNICYDGSSILVTESEPQAGQTLLQCVRTPTIAYAEEIMRRHMEVGRYANLIKEHHAEINRLASFGAEKSRWG